LQRGIRDAGLALEQVLDTDLPVDFHKPSALGSLVSAFFSPPWPRFQNYVVALDFSGDTRQFEGVIADKKQLVTLKLL